MAIPVSPISKSCTHRYKSTLWRTTLSKKNYAQFVSIYQENNIEKGEPFTQGDIDLFWQHKNSSAARMILIMIYSGFRIIAYESLEVHVEEQYFKGGIKTCSGKKHTPHYCRHTFSWLCDKYHVDDLAKHLLMGHSLGNDVEKTVYGHRTLEELRREINKIDSNTFFQ